MDNSGKQNQMSGVMIAEFQNTLTLTFHSFDNTTANGTDVLGPRYYSGYETFG